MKLDTRSSHALARTVFCLYVPILIAMPFGPLLECEHCVSTYMKIFPVIPGAIGVAVTGSAGNKLLIASLGTLLLAVAAFSLLRSTSPRVSKVLLWTFFGLSVLNAVGVANMLRA